jgi:hypothetical protein
MAGWRAGGLAVAGNAGGLGPGRLSSGAQALAAFLAVSRVGCGNRSWVVKLAKEQASGPKAASQGIQGERPGLAPQPQRVARLSSSADTHAPSQGIYIAAQQVLVICRPPPQVSPSTCSRRALPLHLPDSGCQLNSTDPTPTRQLAIIQHDDRYLPCTLPPNPGQLLRGNINLMPVGSYARNLPANRFVVYTPEASPVPHAMLTTRMSDSLPPQAIRQTHALLHLLLHLLLHHTCTAKPMSKAGSTTFISEKQPPRSTGKPALAHARTNQTSTHLIDERWVPLPQTSILKSPLVSRKKKHSVQHDENRARVKESAKTTPNPRLTAT